MPTVQRLRISRAELTCDLSRVVTILSIAFLIAKNFIIISSTLSVDLFIENSLFTKMRKHRPVEVKATLARPHAIKTLLISQISTDIHKTKNVTMLDKRLREAMKTIRNNAISRKITLRSCFISRRCLLHRINRNTSRRAAKILRTLQTSIRRDHTKV